MVHQPPRDGSLPRLDRRGVEIDHPILAYWLRRIKDLNVVERKSRFQLTSETEPVGGALRS